ncbi:MAG: SDR family NAD(P)-dependent oxidoreductase, partial [Candidatus Caenarcaniphilales bacterium]|nr:SDR family NAD(P)-dependent oxidoreductase [Candidatus Caenarcaniphilales bacterium]
MRLLNDLNMDSIKAGSFLGELLKHYNLQGKIDPTSRANASLGEIVSVISEWIVKEEIQEPHKESSRANIEQSVQNNGQLLHLENSYARPTSTKSAIKQTVIKLVSEKTGFPEQDIDLSFKLLDDLNLDSIKAGSLLGQLSKEFNLQNRVEAAQFANASLEDIITAIENAIEPSTKEATAPLSSEGFSRNGQANLQVKQKDSAPASTVQTEEGFDKGWVRSFSANVLRQELNLQELPFKAKLTALVRAGNNPTAINQMSEAFGKWSEKVITITPQDLKNQDLSSIDRLIVFLPEAIDEFAPVIDIIEILSRTAFLTANNKIEVGFVQTGNGLFSREETGLSLEKKSFEKKTFISAVAFAASLHLENPNKKYRVLEFDPETTLDFVARTISAEFSTQESFTAAGYDLNNRRHVMVYDLADKKAKNRNNVEFTANDIVLVTGGGKGITAECALAFAEKYKCKMALIGSSEASKETQEILKKYEDKGLTAKYYSCNITDRDLVDELIQKIDSELGTITCLIHGAGANKPRRSEQVNAEEALKEISPKLVGAWNLVQSLQKHSLKCFVALTSIIGVTGMPGNSWYAFSNEALDLLLRNLRKEKGTETISIAYSVWSDVGMGHRMGSNKVLANMGIGSISPEAGINEFMKWMDKQSNDQQIVVSARLGGLDTWKRAPIETPETNRYLEEIVYIEPGIELIAQSTLSSSDDLYLHDHNFNGSLLFPTVFGLEAMTQAAAYVTGNLNPASVKLENITLLRPIAVPNKGSLKVQIKAVVELDEATSQERVLASISTEDSGFKTDHFSAEIIFNTLAKEKPLKKLDLPKEALAIEAKTDLYSWLMFQGPMFQNIDQVYVLNSDTATFSVKDFSSDSSEKCFSENIIKPFILGSPLLRDLLLQSGQLILTKDVWLPIRIENWEIFRIQKEVEKTYIECKLTKQDGKQAFANVSFVDVEGNLLERISEYEIRALKATPHHPSPLEIADPKFIEDKIQRELKKYENLLGNSIQNFVIHKNAELFDVSKEIRHQMEQSILASKLQALSAETKVKENLQLAWQENGKPVVLNSDLKVSISHSRSLLLMTLGSNEQGCDIEFVENREAYIWESLLGVGYFDILKEIKKIDNSDDLSATRIWCTREAAYKAYGDFPSKITFSRTNNDAVIFLCETASKEKFHVATFTVDIWPGNQLVVALVIKLEETKTIVGSN